MINKPTFKISFSEYSTFKQCPHKWFLSYGLKIGGDSSEELIFGSATHDTIETMLIDKFLSKMSKDLSVVDSIFKSHLKKQFEDIKDLSFLAKMSEGWVAPTFVKQARGLFKILDLHNRFKEYEFVDVEFVLDDLPIAEFDDVILTYKGFIDIVLRHKKTGRYLILDWKTSKKAWDIDKKEIDKEFYSQLKLYKHFYSMKKGVPLDMIDTCFYNLPRAEPELQKQYDKEVDSNEFLSEFIMICYDLYHFNHNKLDKAKFTTPKNWCFRCSFNNLVFCNEEQHQVVVIPKEQFKV